MAKTERNLRAVLSDWRFWMVVAYLGLVSVIVALFVLFNRTAHEQAIRAASAKAAAATQVSQCFIAVKNAPVANGFIDAHEAIIENGLSANEAAIKAAPANDPLRQIRLKSITRLKAAQKNVDELRTLITETTPTRRKCLAMASSLGVDVTPYLKPIHR